jgi:tetratricopeptide (TPR) repeat protein
MNILLVALFLISSLWGASIDIQSAGKLGFHSQDLYSQRGEFLPPPEIFSLEELNRALFTEAQLQNEELKKIKYYLINGETRLARLYLTKLAYTKTKLRPVIQRYLGILYFIEGDFQKSYEHLDKAVLREMPHYAKVCTLKVLNEIILNKLRTLEIDWARCKVENPNNFKEANLLWMDTLVELKLRPREGITKVPFRNIRLAALSLNEAKVLMKLALYLNQEALVAKEIPGLSLEQLRDTEIRELAGQILFRVGSLADAYKFVEDLKSPNAENIKGNLYIMRSKYELAYAQFKLALEQKQNSQNAMERLLPLAWLLGDWESGSIYAQRVLASPQTQINKLTLIAAFQMQKGNFERARLTMDKIVEESRRGTQIDVTQLYSFVALMQNKPLQIMKNADLSCRQYDLVNCWLLYQMVQWDSFPLIVRRVDKIEHRPEWEKLTKVEINQPLKEAVFVNQIDIEEMDDRLIQLIPKEVP